jgi:hypothetical protein
MYSYKDGYINPVRVLDFYNDKKTDSEIIEECMKFASGFQPRTVIFDGKDWLIDRAILLPSNTTVIVDGVKIKQKDLMFDAIFRGDNFEIDPKNPNGFPLKIHPISNIRYGNVMNISLANILSFIDQVAGRIQRVHIS